MESVEQKKALAMAAARARAAQTQPQVDRAAINADMQRMANPTTGMSGLQKFNAGMGGAFQNIIDASKQLVGSGPSPDEVSERRRLDAPLNQTGAGLAGNVAGNIAAVAPLVVMPGANTVGGAAALGGLTAALQPTMNPEERLTNMGVGAALGGGTQYAATTGAQKLGEYGTKQVAEMAGAQSRNAVRDATLKEGVEAGYVVPPSAVGAPSFLGGRLESLGGKAALGQEASLRNQEVSNNLGRRASGLGPDEAISMGNLKAARQKMSGPYREVSALSPQAATDLELVKQAKAESKLYWNEYNRQGTVNAYKAAQAADQQAEAALNRIDAVAQQAGRADLVAALKQARVNIARNHEVRNAVNAGSGDIDASVIGRAFDRNPERFSGELKTIGAFQQQFPSNMRESSKVPAPGVGKTELLAGALLGGGSAAATDSPYGFLAGLAPFASGPARSLLLSKQVQGALAQPNYTPSLTARAAASLDDPETRRRIALMTRSLALPAIPAAVE